MNGGRELGSVIQHQDQKIVILMEQKLMKIQDCSDENETGC